METTNDVVINVCYEIGITQLQLRDLNKTVLHISQHTILNFPGPSRLASLKFTLDKLDNA